MQSGRGKLKKWVLEFETKDTSINPLMGWETSKDTMSEVKLKFFTKEDAIAYAKTREHKIFRVDISAAFEGLIAKTISMEKTMKNGFKQKKIFGVNVLSSGLLGNYGDVIVDNLIKTNFVYGISNGKGDFL